jgi:lipopolysaccharide transport system permease protein
MSSRSAVPVHIYSADLPRGSLIYSVRTACRDLWLTRGVIWQLFLRDFALQFRQKMLGYFWALLTPLLSVISFVFLSVAGVLHPGDSGIPYPLFVFFGSGLWGVLAAVLQTVGGSLVVHGDLVMRTSVPRISLAVSGLATVAYAHLFHLLAVALLMVCFGTTPSWGALLYPVLIVPLFALGTGVGLLLAVVSTVARDANNIVTSVLGVLMLLTPVVYVPQFSNPWCQRLVTYNPLTYLIDVPRNVFFLCDFQDWPGFLWSSALAFVVLLLGIHGFYLIQDKIVERL